MLSFPLTDGATPAQRGEAARPVVLGSVSGGVGTGPILPEPPAVLATPSGEAEPMLWVWKGSTGRFPY